MADGEPSDRRREILARAAQLFAVKGVVTTTVRDIGEAVGILSGSLYHHFASKDAMVEEIVLSYLDDLLTSYRVVLHEAFEPMERIEGLIRASFQAIEDHHDACLVYQNDFTYLHSLPFAERLDASSGEIHRLWLDEFVSASRQGALRDDVDPTVAYRFARDALWFTVRWYRPGGRRRIDDLATEFITMLFDGLRSPTRRTRNGRAGARRGGATTGDGT